MAKTASDLLGERSGCSNRPRAPELTGRWGCCSLRPSAFTVRVLRDDGGEDLLGSTGLRCPADVAMVQATDSGRFHDLAHLGPLEWPHVPEEGRSERHRSGPTFHPHVLCGGSVRRHRNPLVVADENFDSAIAL